MQPSHSIYSAPANDSPQDAGVLLRRCVALLLFSALFWPVASRAEPLLSIKAAGVNAYQLELQGVQRMTRATITLQYVLQGAADPRLTPGDLGTFGSVSIESSSSNGDAKSMTILYVPAAPLNRSGTLAKLTLTQGVAGGARVAGMIATAQMQNVKGESIAVRTEVEEALTSAEAAKAGPAPDTPVRTEERRGLRPANPVPAKPAANIRHRSVKSLLEEFLARKDERTPAALASMAARTGSGEYRQEPPLLLADGAAPLRIVFLKAAAFKETPRFIIKGAQFRGFSWLQSGELVVDLLPNAGALHASITMLTNDETVEYPLSVAPLLASFAADSADPAIDDFVRAANALDRTGALQNN